MSERTCRISWIPSRLRCRPSVISDTRVLNFAKSRCFLADRNRNVSKNGITLARIAVRLFTSKYHTPSLLCRIVPHPRYRLNLERMTSSRWEMLKQREIRSEEHTSEL